MSTIEVRNLTRRFGSFVAVNDISFNVLDSEIFGYLGANGAGKSTTIRMLCGLLVPSSGTINVATVDVTRYPERAKRVIGYMSQKFSLYPDLQVIENLQFFSGMYGIGGGSFHRRAEEVLETMDLTNHRHALTSSLPDGVKQRVALACAIMHKPKILFLDEPTAGVSPTVRQDFWRLIRSMSSEGTTILVTTHYMDEAEYCDRIALMVNGRIAALDTPASLKQKTTGNTMLEIRFQNQQTRLRVEALPGVLSTELLGTTLRLRVNQRYEVDDVVRAAVKLGIDRADIEEADPTLEDVFVEVVGMAGRASQ